LLFCPHTDRQTDRQTNNGSQNITPRQAIVEVIAYTCTVKTSIAYPVQQLKCADYTLPFKVWVEK